MSDPPTPVVSGNVADPGTILFVGDYANQNTPLWLSMFGPKPGPGNVAVSSITVSGKGFASLGAVASTVSTSASYAPLVFQRTTNTPETASGLQMNTSHLVQGVSPDETFVSMTRDNGLFYDDLAVEGIQLFGDTSTDPTVNTGCAGRLYGVPAVAAQGGLGATPSSVRLDTNSFYTSTINANTANISTVNISSLITQSISTITATISTANISSANISTTNISTANISTASLQLANISTANISTTNISTANISTATISRGNISSLSSVNVTGYLNVSETTTTGDLAVKNGVAPAGIGITSQFNGYSATGGTINSVSGIDMYVGGSNVYQLQNLAMRMFATGEITIPHNLSTTHIFSGQVDATTINASTMNTSTINATEANISSMVINGINFVPQAGGSGGSNEIDLGLGGTAGSVGGLVGGSAANVFNTLLGAAALGTGIAGLVLPRTSGGLNSNVFQTYAGTTQFQFSTLATSTQSGFLTTTNGVEQYGTTVSTFTTIPANAWAFRSVSDPLNLATSNSNIGLTSTIQAAGQWNKVFPGNVSMGVNNNLITSLTSQNTIDMGGGTGFPLTINSDFTVPTATQPASDPNININPISTVVIGGGSTLDVRNITNLARINGSPFPDSFGVPVGTMLMWPVGAYTVAPNPPTGYLICDGSIQLIATYPILGALLGVSWSPNYPNPPPTPGTFYLPSTTGRMPIGGIPSTYSCYGSYQGTYSATLPSGGTMLGARFYNIQNNVTGGPAQIYKGMQCNLNGTIARVTNIFSPTTEGGAGWYDDVILLFSINWPMAFPIGTNILFTMQTSYEVPVVGLTNVAGTQTAPGYGKPYRVQQPTEVAPHNHPAVSQSGGGVTTFGSANPIQGSSTGVNNGLYSIDTFGPVAEASYQNPPNFGVTFIIKHD